LGWVKSGEQRRVIFGERLRAAAGACDFGAKSVIILESREGFRHR